MESRFTFKDFVFVVLFVVVIGAVVWAIYQFNYQEERLNGLKQQLSQMSDTQKQQLGVLSEIRNTLQSGVRVNGGETSGGPTTESHAGRIHRTNPDGSIYVYYPDVPTSPRDPSKRPDYAYGDWLVQNLGAEPRLISPILTTDLYGETVRATVTESLMALNPQTLHMEPNIADWYEISADGLKFKFHMRPQVCFSDGVPMTADDVVFSYNTMMNPKVDCEDIRGYYLHVKSCEKIDDHTVLFTMDEPYFRAMEFIGGMTIIPKHIYQFKDADEFNNMPHDKLVGSGAYKLESWSPGKQITLVRNERYWGERPTFDRIVYRFIGNPQAILQSFQNGELDEYAYPLPPDPDQYVKLSQDPEFLKKFKAYKYASPLAGYFYIGWNMTEPLFKDKETRQALTMLVDRQAIIHTILKDMAAEMTGPFNPLTPQNDKSVKPLPFDVEKAKQLLAAAGWKRGSDGVLQRDGKRFSFDLSLRSNAPSRERIATYIQAQYQQAGIEMKITPWEPAVLMDRLDKRQFDAVLAGWGGGGVEEDPYQIWDSASIANMGSNHVSFSNPEADKLIAEGRRTLDEEKRMEIWHRLQRIIYDEQPYLFLYAPLNDAFINGRFKNTDPYPIGLVESDWYVPAAEQKYH